MTSLKRTMIDVDFLYYQNVRLSITWSCSSTINLYYHMRCERNLVTLAQTILPGAVIKEGKC